MENEKQDNVPQKEPIGDVLKKYKEMRDNGTLPSPESVTSLPLDEKQVQHAQSSSIPPSVSSFNSQQYEETMNKETDQI